MENYSKKDILLSEILGDTGKILDDCEKIYSLIPKISSEYTLEMKELLENWKKNAEMQNTNIINSSKLKIQNEVRDIIQLELSSIIQSTFLHQENNVEELISKKLDKYLYFAVAISTFIFFSGLMIGKYFIR